MPTIRSLLVFALSILTASCTITGEKPILAMTPSEIFLKDGPRRLAESARRGDAQTINRLVNQGVNVNTRGKFGITPIFSVLQVGNLKGTKLLLEKGADPNAAWETGNSMVHIAAGMKDPRFLIMLLDYGADPNLINPRIHETPIFEAATPDGKINLETLLNAGANIDFQNSMGQTPMMVASALNQYDVVYKLLVAGADYTIVDNLGDGNDIRDYIRIEGAMDKSGELYRWRQKVIDFLKEKGFWKE